MIDLSQNTISTTSGRALLTLDPGIRRAGSALFFGSRLIAATVVDNPVKRGAGVAACVAMGQAIAEWASRAGLGLIHDLIVEWPQVYASQIRKGQSPGDPNDLLSLVGVGCALAAQLPDATLHERRPAEWKGQVPGDTFTARILGRLEASEIEVLARGCLRNDPILHTDRIRNLLKSGTAHNAIDAVGIGLDHLGRLGRRRVIPR